MRCDSTCASQPARASAILPCSSRLTARRPSQPRQHACSRSAAAPTSAGDGGGHCGRDGRAGTAAVSTLLSSSLSCNSGSGSSSESDEPACSDGSASRPPRSVAGEGACRVQSATSQGVAWDEPMTTAHRAAGREFKFHLGGEGF